ncbi:uncharacterized protein [Physcomitrium patens]|uniref:Ubiquitin-like domain-containing protein n=1 Tax=Physcomitrium patens TaxID=3218 RepID=A0A2K1KAA5_PHYPA|nr:uncharacterized protein LOC112285023 [Physcomitrium patens]PNR50707.1 hypothetical protein PHYPA_009893 [Physcomitrium patens]|eukprot:XP_024381244.1 uncharacterized protein LOC112285023 [Physcomitrella patens]
MGITVAVKVDHFPIVSSLVTASTTDKSRTVLVPNLDFHGTVRDTLVTFLQKNLFISEECQLLSAPLFTRLSDKDNVEDIYKRYSCQADQEISEIHLDEDTFMMYGREGGRFVDLVGEKRVEDYHILDRSTLHLRRLPRPLSEDGGRVFVECKDGIIPLLGVTPLTPISGIKHHLEGLTGVPISQQLLSSVGRVMHDEFLVRDFDVLHKVYEDSVIDLCKSEDKNAEQVHKRMVVHVNVVGEEEFSIVVQGRDTVLSVLRCVESRIGIAPSQLKISYSGKLLQEKKTLGSYLIQPDSVLTVTLSKCLTENSRKPTVEDIGALPKEFPGQKPNATKLKLMRTSRGHVKGTLTIPVISSDTVADLKRKLKRTLAPLVERDPSPAPTEKQQPFGDTMVRTPGKSPMRTPPSSHYERYGHGSNLRGTPEGRRPTSETKPAGVRSLSFSKMLDPKPNPHTPQQSPMKSPLSASGPRSGPLPPKIPLEDHSVSTTAPSSAKKITFSKDDDEDIPSAKLTANDLHGSSCRDLMPELLSLPDLDPKDQSPIKVVVEKKPTWQSRYADENAPNSGGRFGNVQSKIDNKLGAIKNIDKKAVKNWFNTNMESFKVHMKNLADG